MGINLIAPHLSPSLPPPIIVFDLGNVLIRYAPGGALYELSRRSGLAPWKIRWAFLRAGGRKLSSGRIPPGDFAREVSRRLRIPLTPGELSRLSELDFPSAVPGMLEWAAALRPRVRCAILSDTIAFHWEACLARFPDLRLFPEEDVYLSYRLGLSKPDLRLYQLVDARLRQPTIPSCPPSRILYFDDRKENIRAARRAGWSAHLFRRAVDFEQVLGREGFFILNPASGG